MSEENEEMYDETEEEFEAAEEIEEAASESDDEDAQDGAAATEPQHDSEANDSELWDKVNKAARLVNLRHTALKEEKEAKAGKPSLLIRALTLLELKPKMEQKEMADLLGVKLRELDGVMSNAEDHDLVARIEPEEEDMRKVVVSAADDAMDRAQALEQKTERLIPGFSDEDMEELVKLLNQVIIPLEKMGLGAPADRDEERGDRRGGREDHGGRGGFGGRGDRRGGRDDRGFRGGDRGGRGGFGDRGGRGGDRDHRGGDRGGFGGRGGDRGGSRGGYGRGHEQRSGAYRGYGDRGGRGGFGDRGGRGGYGDRRGGGRY